VDEEDEVLVVMEKGKIVRSRVDEVRRTGRNTMGVQFATPDKRDSIVAVARNADRGIDVVLDTVLGDPQGAPGGTEPGTGGATDPEVPTMAGSASEGEERTDSVTFDLDSDEDGAGGDNPDNDNADNDAGGSE
jgi:DNA gyrase subunit A